MNTYIIIGMGIGIVVAIFLIRVVFRKDKDQVYDLYKKGMSLVEDESLKIRIKAILSGGHKIEAIKYVNEKYKTGLAQAKSIVEKIESSSSNIDIIKKSERKTETNEIVDNENLKRVIKVLLSKGKKIEAIKLIAETKKSGLKAAKDFVDSLENEISKTNK